MYFGLDIGHGVGSPPLPNLIQCFTTCL